MKALVIIPVYNEEKNIEKVINDLQIHCKECDYIIVNDCSNDGTKALCERKNYKVIHLPVNLGIGGGMQTGYKYAYENGYDVAIQFDGDGQHNAQYINELIKKLETEQLDMVIGSRFLTKEGFQSSFMRRMGIRFFSRLLYMLTKQKITDPTSGFRVVNKQVIESFCRYYPKDYPEPESIAAILRQGYRIGEMPVLMNERVSGVSSINLGKSIYYMIKVSMAICIDTLKVHEGRQEECHYN
ncbi:MAG: glycosyltransferase family 2 protein [Cellulosilyticum sp.]|nr:glycosyltransferase family 2 protein [Cellulosilyticum sp.]